VFQNCYFLNLNDHNLIYSSFQKYDLKILKKFKKHDFNSQILFLNTSFINFIECLINYILKTLLYQIERFKIAKLNEQ
jgi:hypothetical protein